MTAHGTGRAGRVAVLLSAVALSAALPASAASAASGYNDKVLQYTRTVKAKGFKLLVVQHRWTS